MTKKKRGHPDVEEILSRPWCGRRLNTAGGLNVHMNQVHKETLSAIENALPNRAGLDVEIFGMEGIPEDVVQQHNQRVLTQFHQAEAERRAATGNPAPGTQGGTGVKKTKFESPADLKKRLAEHKAAKLAAEQNGGGSSESNTPTPAQAQVANFQQPQQVVSPAYPGYQQSYPAPPSSASFPAAQSHSIPAAAGYQTPGYGVAPGGFSNSPAPQQQLYARTPPPYSQPFGQPLQPSFQHPPFPAPSAFSPPPFQATPTFPAPAYQTQVPQNGVTSQVGVPRIYPSASPASAFPLQQRTYSPAQSVLPQRTGSAGSLPNAPGLPQRPAVSAPSVNAAQFQQMHQGQIPLQHNLNQSQSQHPQSHEEYNPAAPQIGMPRGLSTDDGGSSLDDLISSASKHAAENAARAKTATPNPPPSQPLTTIKDDVTDGKSGKKDKDVKDKANKATRMVYSDTEISPEEKRAQLERYRFTRI